MLEYSMAQSMTGFASQTTTLGEWKLSFECKSVNSRFLDITLKLPDVVKVCESQLRQIISEALVRGKVEFTIRLERDESFPEGKVNADKLAELEHALEIIRNNLSDLRPPSALDVLQMPGVWVSEKADTKSLIAHCLTCAPDVLTALIAHRQSERLRDRINALNINHDEKRLEEELVFLANKSDVAEELDRLEAHIEAIYEALNSNEPCGRRLDFLMQELNREANTLGSKTNSLSTTNAAVELKVLIEQMREQVQNLE
jgi:uncharacterized protein YicC (UPF0701 family)